MIGRVHTGLRVARPKAVETRVNRAEGQQRRGLAPDLGAPPLASDGETGHSPWQERLQQPGRVCMQEEDMGAGRVGMRWTDRRLAWPSGLDL